MLMIGNFDLLLPSENITVIAVSCTVRSYFFLPFDAVISCYTAFIQMARGIVSIGYDVCFVVALVKTVRVAYIFRFVTPNKKVYHIYIYINLWIAMII